MKNPLSRLKWWGKKHNDVPLAFPERVNLEYKSTIQHMDESLNSKELLDRIDNPRGGVRKTKHKQYKLDDHPHGGRVVKTMPRQLRHMKELAEKTDE